MLSWLLRQLSDTEQLVEHIDEVQFDFQYGWVLIVGLVLLVPVGAWIVLRQRRNLATVPPKLRITLSLTRIAILALLVLALAGPFVRLDHRDEKKPVVAVLLDHSQSMQLPAGPYESDAELSNVARAAGYRNLDSSARLALNRITRAKLTHSTLQAARPFLEELSGRFDVRYYSFAQDVTRLGIDPSH